VAQNLFDLIFLRILRHILRRVVVPRVCVLLKGFEVCDVVDVVWYLYSSGGDPNFVTSADFLFLGSRAIIGVGVGLCRWTRRTRNNCGSKLMSRCSCEDTVAGSTFGFGWLFPLLRGSLLGAIFLVGVRGIAIVVIFLLGLVKIILVSLMNMSMFLRRKA
jgi:hypothetical protein